MAERLPPPHDRNRIAYYFSDVAGNPPYGQGGGEYVRRLYFLAADRVMARYPGQPEDYESSLEEGRAAFRRLLDQARQFAEGTKHGTIDQTIVQNSLAAICPIWPLCDQEVKEDDMPLA